jgi:hypothetical protein
MLPFPLLELVLDSVILVQTAEFVEFRVDRLPVPFSLVRNPGDF